MSCLTIFAEKGVNTTSSAYTSCTTNCKIIKVRTESTKGQSFYRYGTRTGTRTKWELTESAGTSIIGGFIILPNASSVIQPSSKMSTLKNTSCILTELPQHTVHADDPSVKATNLAPGTNAVHDILEEFSKRSFYSLDAKDADAIDRFLDEKLLALSMVGEPEHDFYSAACAFMGPSFFGDHPQDAENDDSGDIPTMTELNRGCSLMSYVDPHELLDAVFDPTHFFEQQDSPFSLVTAAAAAAAAKSASPLAIHSDFSHIDVLRNPPFSGPSITPTLLLQSEMPKNLIANSMSSLTKKRPNIESSPSTKPRKKVKIALDSQEESNSNQVRIFDQRNTHDLENLPLRSNSSPTTNKTTNKKAINNSKKKVIKLQACGGAWESMYKECQAYFKRHGHCAIPATLPENPALAKWAKSLRGTYQRRRLRGESSGALTSNQITLLNDIQFCWKLVERKWNLRCDKLREQFQKTGSSSMSASAAKWLRRQQTQWADNKLSTEQVQKLMELGVAKSESITGNNK
jgi:hypothetical protein